MSDGCYGSFTNFHKHTKNLETEREGEKSLRQTQNPLDKRQSPLAESSQRGNEYPDVVEVMFQSLVNVKSVIGHHSCVFNRLITYRLHSDIQIINSAQY